MSLIYTYVSLRKPLCFSGLATAMEHKYDGERAQIHLLQDGTVKIFSRNSEDNSEKYPDLREVIRRNRCEVMLLLLPHAYTMLLLMTHVFTPSITNTHTHPFINQTTFSILSPHPVNGQGLTNCVIDAEVVAYDREKKCLLPFQVLSTRKRKVEEGDEENQKVKVVLQLFDLIFANGTSLLQSTLRQRR